MPPRALAFIALLAGPGAAAAQDGDEVFARIDQNGDGILSTQERESDVARSYDWIAVDRNRDGRVTRPEFGTVPVARSGARRSAAGGTQPPAQDKAATGSARP